MADIDLDSDLLEYIVQEGFQPGDRLPTINELQADERLGISISKVREQLEVARALGLVEVKSKTGMKMKSYSFTPAVRLSLFFALAQDQHSFELFGEVRNHIEVAFWSEACALLQDEDKQIMRDCLEKARAKLNGKPIRIPNEEHRAFHLTVFRRLDNPFVMGILEAALSPSLSTTPICCTISRGCSASKPRPTQSKGALSKNSRQVLLINPRRVGSD
jgi:DNA-binding FadR family transcriptional regulator